MWEVGKAGNGIGARLVRRPKPPTPALPEEEGALSDADCKLLPSVWYEPQSASQRLQATCRFSRFPGRGRPCRLRSGAHAARTTKTLSPSSHSSRVTSYGPSRHRHHVPRTKYHVPIGRTHGSAPTTKTRTRAAGHLLLLRHIGQESLMACASWNPDRSSLRRSRLSQETMATMQSPNQDF